MVNAFKDHWTGIIQTFQALAKGKFLLFFIPGLIVGLIYLYFQFQANRAASVAHLGDDIPLLGTGVSWVTDQLFGLFNLIFTEIYKFIILVLLSPINCILSEKFDSYLTGKEYQFSLIRLINDFLRMILIVISAIILEYFFLGIWWIVQWFLPDFIGETMFFLIASFFFGFSFYDFSMERYGLSFSKSWRFGFSKMSYMILTGAIFNCFMQVPSIGIILAPVLSSMISTAVYILIIKKQNNQSLQVNS